MPRHLEPSTHIDVTILPTWAILANTNIPDTSLDVIPPMLWWNIERALISSSMYVHDSSDSTDY